MSLWLTKRNADGRQELWQIDVEPMSIVFVIGLLAAFVVPQWTQGPVAVAYDGGILIAIGFLCVLVAKMSLFRRGIWRSWGPRQMSKWCARLYKSGYVLLCLGVFLVFVAYGAGQK